MTTTPSSIGRQGTYAGPVSRLCALVLDVVIAWYSLIFLGAGITFAVRVTTNRTVSISHLRITTAIAVVIWFAFYFTYQWALSGKTLGMAILGLRVVSFDGGPLTKRAALLRTIALPISILTLGSFGIVFTRRHRGLHDAIARTCVVYDWDARAARLRWLATRNTENQSNEPLA